MISTTTDAGLFTRRGNLSVLYIDNKFQESKELQAVYHEPKFTAVKELSHMFHGSHHQTALRYMCDHHTGDDSPQMVQVGQVIPPMNGPFPFFKGASKDESPRIATWTRPAANDRIDFSSIQNHFTQHSQQWNRDAVYQPELNVTYLMCKSCNAIMTGLSYMRYIVGFTGTAAKNSYGCIIREGVRPIQTYVAVTGNRKIKDAYGTWKRKGPANAQPDIYPSQGADTDPLAPHIAYYLHMCLPFSAAVNQDFIQNAPNLAGSQRAARCTYTELCWIILIIACTATLTEQGKTYGDHKLSHGMHPHYGVLDVYVSFFIWRLVHFDYSRELAGSGLDFVQWHQKYFWDAVHCPGINSVDNLIVGQTCYMTVQQNSRALVEQIGRKLMDLYTGQLKPLIQLVTNTLPLPAALSPEEDFVKRFFIPLESMRRIARLGGQRVSFFLDLFPVFPFRMLKN